MQAKAPGLDTPHPPAKDAPEVKLKDAHTADGEQQEGLGGSRE